MELALCSPAGPLLLPAPRTGLLEDLTLLPLPPPPPLGPPSRPERPAGAGRRSASPGGARGVRRRRRLTPRLPKDAPPLPLPPPPSRDPSRPERPTGAGRRSASPGGAGGVHHRGRHLTPRLPEDAPPLPPPLGSSRLEGFARSPGRRASSPEAGGRRSTPTLRLESDDARPAPRSTATGRSPSPGAGAGGGGRRRRRRSPPLRSPSPAPPKRSRRGSSWNRCRRSEGGCRDACGRSRSPDRPHSGYGGTTNGQDNTERLGLMTYKQFTQVLEDDVSPAQAGDRYQEYMTEYINTQKRAYFDLNKNEDWLKDMYHPTKLLYVIKRRNDFCKTVANDFTLGLLNGTLDTGPGVTADAAIKSVDVNDGSSKDDADYGEKKRKFGRGPRKEIEPLPAAPEAHPVSSQCRRIHTDIDRTLALVKQLDSEKNISRNVLSTGDHGKSKVDKSCVRSMRLIVRGLNTVKALEGVELLDTLLTYLWRVHGVDYYGMSEMKYAKGFRHVRAESKSGSRAENINAIVWEKKLDSFWEERLVSGEDPLLVLTAKDKIDSAIVERLEQYVRKMRDENYVWKYGCGAKGCEKLFHAPEYVHKHLRLKHPDLVSILASRVVNDIYFQNYMNDPDAPGGKPVMQQTIPDRTRQRPDGQKFGAPGGRGSDAALLPKHAPSLILVPVPGAGAHGPFVPARPEIAMQMMQKGLLGPAVAQHSKPLVLGPMLPMYPSIPLGSHIYRSYKDLDVPKEEITALDLRSL